jgi:uncharacterized protein YyaL (SSP411 family)
MTNRLANESSPYLRQHAENPVDWLPWGDEALARARAEDKPIFLSIGYSACHWCHVMAHESFEDANVAAVMNAHFVNIKVDREERPDLDHIYMAAVQIMTGNGGWPMSVFLTPDGTPFYGGTYYPPEPRHGLPAFADVLQGVADAWQSRRGELLAAGGRLAAAVERQTRASIAAGGETLREEALEAAIDRLRADFDTARGGWGRAPKFPQPMILEFLLRFYARTGEKAALAMATQTLDAMARGGMYDQLGGGFHRYSVDDHWLVPHFEKMLYDNAQLARVYLHAWQLTRNRFFRTIARETLDYVAREMLGPEGGFYSAQDADSEGQEGKLYVWTADEIRALLGDQADEFMAAYGVTAGGNWEGTNVLELVGSVEQREALADARRTLFRARQERVHPGRDEKVLTSWNGLMLAAFAEAAVAWAMAGDTERGERYLEIAEHNAGFLLHRMQDETGALYHAWMAAGDREEENPPAVEGFLEDYANLAEGLLALCQATFNPRWYRVAHTLVDAAVARFWVPGEGFYDTDDGEELFTRPRDLQDNATPAGNSMITAVLLKLSDLAMTPRYDGVARQNLGAVQELLMQVPQGSGQWLVALDYALSRPFGIAIIGGPGDESARALLEVALGGYRPHQVIACGPGEATQTSVPLLEGRDLVDGRAAAYVCREFTCRAPVTDPEELKAELERG